METLLKPEEVAQKLQCSTAFVRRLVRERKLLAVRNGHRGRIRIAESDLQAYVDDNKQAEPVRRVRPRTMTAPVQTPEELRLRTRELASKRRRPLKTA